MQKTAYCGREAIAIPFFRGKTIGLRLPAQMLRIMRLTTFLLLAFCLHLSAKTHSQAITLTVKNAPLKDIFSVLKKQAGYYVFYKNDLLDNAKPVSLSVYDMPVEDFLKVALKDQGLYYEITNRTIMLTRKHVQPATPAPAAAAPPNTKTPPPKKKKGQVLSNGHPLGGVSVMLMPVHRGTATDDKGFFTLHNVPQ